MWDGIDGCALPSESGLGPQSLFNRHSYEWWLRVIEELIEEFVGKTELWLDTVWYREPGKPMNFGA